LVSCPSNRIERRKSYGKEHKTNWRGEKETPQKLEKKTVPRGKEVHHKNPLSKGGSDSLRNVKLVSKKTHRRIHKKK
jgi:hypothetical protein